MPLPCHFNLGRHLNVNALKSLTLGIDEFVHPTR